MATQESVSINTRVRLQRLSDAKFFSGWVKEFTRTDLVVRMGSLAPMAGGDVFMVQVHGPTFTALFKAVLRSAAEKDLCFTIPEPVRFLKASEQVRVSVVGVSALVTASNRAFESMVVDLSTTGAGLLATRELKKGEIVRVMFTTPVGEIECGAEVRYCKPDSIDDGSFRVGLQLEQMGRIERARWNRLVDQDAA